jgi:hypothetical protein
MVCLSIRRSLPNTCENDFNRPVLLLWPKGSLIIGVENEGGMPALHRRASSRLHLFRADLGWCQVIHPTTSFAPAPQVTARQRNIAITEINKPERNVWIAHDKDIGRLAGCCNFKAPVWVSHPKLAREGTIIGGEAVSGPRFRGPKNAAETSDRENLPCSAMALSFVG